MTGSEGVHVFDAEGNRFYDGIGGLWCVNAGPHFEKTLKSLEYLDIVGEVRGSHLMACIENVANKETKELRPADVDVGKRVAQHSQKRGLIVRPPVHLNILSPPLTLTEGQIDEIGQILRDTIVAVVDDLASEAS